MNRSFLPSFWWATDETLHGNPAARRRRIRPAAWAAGLAWLLMAAAATAQTKDLHVREIALVHFCHTDIGFTDHPSVCRDLQRRFLDVAIDAAHDSRKRPKTERFHWTAESTMSVKDWWDAATPKRRRQFLAAVRSGQLDVSALPFNNTPFMNAQQWQTMVYWLPKDVWKKVRPKVAIQNDVNGFPRAGAVASLDRGVRYLFTGINTDSGGCPFRRPSAFWWKMPDGRRLFVWLNIGYGSGFDFFESGSWRRGPVPQAADTCYRPPRAGEYLRSDEASVREYHARCVEKIRHLEESGYEYELLTIALTNQWRYDSDPPFPPIADFVATWNRLGLKPTLRFTTVSDAMQRMEAIMGEDAPEYTGEWTDWWANGTASAPREVAASREAKRYLDAAQSPLWGPMTDSTRRTVDALLRDLCLFDEHTWGNSLSVTQPYSLETVGQFTEKSILAYRPRAQSEWLLSQRARTRLFGEGEGLFVANATNAPFSGWVTVFSSCLREPFQSVADSQTGARYKLYFEPGIEPWGRPRRPEDLSREDISATFPDNAPNKIAKFWVENLGAHSVKHLRLSQEDMDDATANPAKSPAIETNDSNWPTSITWPGMSQPLFLPGIGNFAAVQVDGFAPRWVLADLRGSRSEELRKETLREIPAVPDGKAAVNETPHTLCYTQAIQHPRLQWGTRILEVWKREPRVRLTLRVNRLSSVAPEIFYADFPLPTGNTLPRVSNGGIPFVPFTDQLPGTCRDYFAIDGWAVYDTPNGQWLWVSRDVPLIAFGASPTLAFRDFPPKDVHRLRAMLFNNFWYTNFVGDSHGIMEFQFDLVWTSPSNSDAEERASALASKPVVLINPAAPEDPRLMEYVYRP